MKKLSFALILACLGLGTAAAIISACSDGSSSGGRATKQCNASSTIVLNDSLGAGGNTLSTINLESPLACQDFYATEVDSCGNFIANVTPDSWALDAAYGYLDFSNGPRGNFCFNRGRTPSFATVSINLVKGVNNYVTPLVLTWAPTSIPDFFRWYKADSYMPMMNSTVVGQAGQSTWIELSSDFPLYNGVANAGLEPNFNTVTFPRPTVQFGMHQLMRIAPSFSDFSNTDMTVFFVVARGNANPNFILANEQNTNNTGTFFGWTSNTQVRFSLAGPGGTPNVTANVAAYGGSPQLEIWSGRLNTGSSNENPGLRLYRNNSEVATDAAVNTQQGGSNTIPYIGTQRSENNNALFYVGEVLVYKRALSGAESCSVQKYLSAKYGVTLVTPCP